MLEPVTPRSSTLPLGLVAGTALPYLGSYYLHYRLPKYISRQEQMTKVVAGGLICHIVCTGLDKQKFSA